MTALSAYLLLGFTAALLAILTISIARWKSILPLLGWHLQQRNKWKRERLRHLVAEEEAKQNKDGLKKNDAPQREEKEAPYTPDRPKDWDGCIGFFHPFWYDSSFVAGHHALY